MAVTGPPRTVVLDAEALSALAERRRGVAEWLEAARREDHRVVVPTVILAELMVGGPRDAALWHVVRRLPHVEVDVDLAARAGALRAGHQDRRRKKRDLTVDAIVAATASAMAPSAVLTADVDDLSLLLAAEDVVVSDIAGQT